MKIFISADIEGTAGIAHWDETEQGKHLYDHFALQMTREVVAACEGAIAAGADELFIKDAHDSARNIDPDCLPECAKIFRGWGRHPYSMMAGLDHSFDGVFFTGYHSGAGSDENPLAHTMNGNILKLDINGLGGSELLINCLTAAYEHVPVYCVCGDAGLCDWVTHVNPNIQTVPVCEGFGNGSISIQPALAVKRIRETTERALRLPRESCLFPLPEAFDVTVEYRPHFMAKRAGFYPGAEQVGPRTVRFHANNYFDVLTFFSFVL
ncbi:MAG: M55 family metallopeptidase [Clostridia bacterium]